MAESAEHGGGMHPAQPSPLPQPHRPPPSQTNFLPPTPDGPKPYYPLWHTQCDTRSSTSDSPGAASPAVVRIAPIAILDTDEKSGTGGEGRWRCIRW